MLTGGCLCGEVRYETDATPVDRGICHCETCRRVHTAPMVAWFSVPRDSFRLVSGEPKSFASSEHVARKFCPTCGAHVIFDDRRSPSEIDIAVASLDDPNAAAPEMHIWVTRRLPWVKICDGLREHAESSRSPIVQPASGGN